MENRISFKLIFFLFKFDEFDVDMITDYLNIIPSKSWKKNDISKDNLKRKESCWEVESKEYYDFTMTLPLADFLAIGMPEHDKIKSLIQNEELRSQIDVIVSIHGGKTMPGIHLDENIIKKLADLKCSIDFDIYDYRK